jgi:three-Cys-motif partner protein
MAKQKFKFAYIDAFAGTGYRREERQSINQRELFPALQEKDLEKVRDGSARIALQVDPSFEKYVFIEENSGRFDELEKLRAEFPDRATDIMLVNADANEWLIDRCQNYNWRRHRAVVFLDPFGLQVEWGTVEAIAQTGAIDLWNLFPLGAAMNRLLIREGEIPEEWQMRIDATFGTHERHDVFYSSHPDLTGEMKSQKIVNLEGIGEYYTERLKSVFPFVAERPRPLYNSRGNPLYLLCFASPNKTAAKIAQDILNKPL